MSTSPIHRPLTSGSPSRAETEYSFLVTHSSLDTDDCIEWPFGRTPKGYGRIRNGRSVTSPSRLMCRMVYGDPEDKKLEAAHSCGNRLCINPRHLRWATPKENKADKILHGTTNRGAKNPNNILTETQAIEVVGLLIKGEKSHNQIAKMFGVGPASIRNIYTGKSWRWLLDERGIDLISLAGSVRARKLSQEKASEIRRLYSTKSLTYQQIAEQFSITRQAASLVVRGKSWA